LLAHLTSDVKRRWLNRQFLWGIREGFRSLS